MAKWHWATEVNIISTASKTKRKIFETTLTASVVQTERYWNKTKQTSPPTHKAYVYWHWSLRSWILFGLCGQLCFWWNHLYFHTAPSIPGKKTIEENISWEEKVTQQLFSILTQEEFLFHFKLKMCCFTKLLIITVLKKNTFRKQIASQICSRGSANCSKLWWELLLLLIITSI